jgi:hypothetical protein
MRILSIYFDLIFLVPFLSLLIRALLIQSGSVEKNPGPQPKNLTFATWNIDSLLADEGKKINLVECIQSVHDFDIFGICETYLTDNITDSDLSISGFEQIPKRADNKQGGRPKGGVCLYFKSNIPLKRRTDLETMDETIVVEINLNRKKIIYLLTYRSPSQSPAVFDTYMQNLQVFYSKALLEKPSSIVMTGDFNCRSPLLWSGENVDKREGRVLADFCTANSVVQMIDEPTHFPRDGIETCLDLILTNQPFYMVDKGVLPSPDPSLKHHIVHGKFNFSIPSPPPYKRKIWDYKHANVQGIKTVMNVTPWDFIFINKSPSEMATIFSEHFLKAIESYVPSKVMTFNDRDAPWITPSLKNLVRKNTKIFKKWASEGKPESSRERVKQFQKTTNEAILDAKSDYMNNLSKKLCDPTVGKKTFWSAFNRITNKKKITNIPPLFENNNYITNFKEKAVLFNSYFAAQCRPLNIDSVLPPFAPLTENCITDVNFTEGDIVSVIKKLDVKKAHGHDGISIAMLKLCPNEVAKPLNLIFKKCISTGEFPDLWKLANVQPVHKKNSRQEKSNYRPISLLPICGKIFEKIVFDSLYRFLIENGLITENQSGFRPGDSTINQLLAITNEIHKSFERVNETRAVFLDISKAFDKVWHPGLIFKLKQNGVNGKLLECISSYLSNRKQRVVLNGVDSPWESILSGVPQGSVLGPLLFLIYINDLTNNISAKMKLFADDSSLFMEVETRNTTDAHNTLIRDLETITTWANTWRMKFNPDITKQAEEVIFSHKRNLVNHPPLEFNTIPVARVDVTKHLGLFLDKKLSFKKHINEAIEKAKKGITLMKFLSKYVNRSTLSLTYKMHVRPHLEYGDIIFHNCSKALMDQIESIQYQAGLITTGCWKNTSREKLYNELGWESLAERRRVRRLCNYHEILTDNKPDYLKRQILTTVPPNATQRYKNTFFPFCLSEWDGLDPSLKNIPRPALFKKKMFTTIRPNGNKTFVTNDRRGIKLLTCLRVEHSDLRAHRYPKNFNCSDPTCACGREHETVEHFFLRCPYFAAPRTTMLSSINDIHDFSNMNHAELSNVLLYGQDSLTSADNRSIIKAAIKFINDSKRFKTLEAFFNRNDPDELD